VVEAGGRLKGSAGWDGSLSVCLLSECGGRGAAAMANQRCGRARLSGWRQGHGR
jgi:hypothetical protein